MTKQDFKKHMAQLYGKKASDPTVAAASELALPIFSSAKPWRFCRATAELTPDSSGIITMPDDYDGVITMRQEESSKGGWIQPWSEEKFDFTFPRTDAVSGNYAAYCKTYEQDGEHFGQLIPEVTHTVYLTYKRKITDISKIPGKYLAGLIATFHRCMTKPADGNVHLLAINAQENEEKKLWKKDRKEWAQVFRTLDDQVDIHSIMWYGPWAL